MLLRKLSKEAPNLSLIHIFTVQNVELVKVIEEKNLMLIKGAVPGNKGGLVRIQYAVKGQDK